MAKIRFLADDERGVTAVEFALVAPFMIFMLMGLMEYGYVMFARSSLEHATLDAARSAVASHCQATRKQDMIDIVNDEMSVILAYDDQPTEIDYRSYNEDFDDVGNPEPYNDTNGNGIHDTGETFNDVNGNGQWDSDMGKSSSVGAAGQVVSYRTSFKALSLFPGIANMFNDGRPYYQLVATTVVRNEPVFMDDCSA